MNLENYLSKILTPWRIFFLALIIMIPMILMENIPARDIALRYAPMADAFARRDWEYAFHPRIPVLHPLLAGIVAAITGCGGFMACKLISGLFYALTVFPAYALYKQLFDRSTALLGTLMTVLCSHLIRLGYSGLRESIKEFAIVLGVYALVTVYRDRNRRSGYFYGVLAFILLALCRVDSVLFSLLLIIAILVCGFRKQNHSRWIWRFLGCGIVASAMLTPSLIYNYHTIGYPVPEIRMGIILDKSVPQLHNKDALFDIHRKEVNPETADIPQAKEAPLPASADKKEIEVKIKNYLESIIDGFYPFFLVLAIPVIILRIRKKQWQPTETLVLGALLVHTLLVLLQILIFDHTLYVSTRYLTPAAPLSFGWAAQGIIIGVNSLTHRYPNVITPVRVGLVASVAGMLLLLDAWEPLIKDFTSPEKSRERQATLCIAQWIKNDFHDRTSGQIRQRSWEYYLSNRSPVVYCQELAVVGYLAGGQNFNRKYPLPPDYIIIEDQPNSEQTDPISIFEKKYCFPDSKSIPAHELTINGSVYRIFRREK